LCLTFFDDIAKILGPMDKVATFVASPAVGLSTLDVYGPVATFVATPWFWADDDQLLLSGPIGNHLEKGIHLRN
jgi:hypothetical protein